MKLNADLPKWITYPLRLILYSFVMFVLFNIAVAFVSYRVANNTIACSGQASVNYGGALSQAKAMVSCLKNKNGIFEDLLMRSTYSAIEAMPNTPKQFVGVWDASQPQCNYRHTLNENGEFISESKGCSFGSTSYRGAWGVYGGKMIWLPDEGEVWPPDINQIDSVDSDFFLLVEKDGSRTKFSRVKEIAASTISSAQNKTGRLFEDFVASSYEIYRGDSATLTATFNGNGKIEGIGPIKSGVPVTVTPTETTTYNFHVSNGNAGVAFSQTIKVVPLEVPRRNIDTWDNFCEPPPPNEISIENQNKSLEKVRCLPFGLSAPLPSALSISADGHTAAHISSTGDIAIWDFVKLQPLNALPFNGKKPSAVALSPDGDLVAIGYFKSGEIKIWSHRDFKIVSELQGHNGGISALTFSPDGRFLASGGNDATTFVWDVSTGHRLHAFDSQFGGSGGGIVVGLGFSGDMRILAVNEWYSRHYDVDRGTTLWDLEEGIEIGTRNVAPPNSDNVIRSGQALGANNWLLTYTDGNGLEVERLDSCEKPHISGPAVTDYNQQNGKYANTVVADPKGRWVAALDYQKLMFYGTKGDAAPVTLDLPIRPIALVSAPEGNKIFALAIKETHINGNEHFIIGRDAETVTLGALYEIDVPESARQLPALSINVDAVSCPPSDTARKLWSYHLSENPPVLPLKVRLNPPGEMPSYKSEEAGQDRERFNPPTDLYFSEDGTLYVLHYAKSNAQSGVVVWDPDTTKVLRSNFQLYPGETIFRIKEGWASRKYSQLQNLLTGELLLSSDEKGNVGIVTDADTGEIYRIVDGQLERYDSDAIARPLPIRKEAFVSFVAARNDYLAILYADGIGEVWGNSTKNSKQLDTKKKLWQFDSTAMVVDDGCGMYGTPILSADGKFLEIPWGCVDNPTDYQIVDLKNGTRVTTGPILGLFPKQSSRVVVPDARPNHLDVWDLGKGELLGRLPRQPSRDKDGNYYGLLSTISDNGRLVASASFDGLVRVWDIDAKHVVGEATINGRVTSMEFNSTGKSLAVGLTSGEVLILEMP